MTICDTTAVITIHLAYVNDEHYEERRWQRKGYNKRTSTMEYRLGADTGEGIGSLAPPNRIILLKKKIYYIIMENIELTGFDYMLRPAPLLFHK